MCRLLQPKVDRQTFHKVSRTKSRRRGLVPLRRTPWPAPGLVASCPRCTGLVRYICTDYGGYASYQRARGSTPINLMQAEANVGPGCWISRNMLVVVLPGMTG